MNTLPEDVITNHIMPYTYNLLPKQHLLNIRSFSKDIDIIENVYVFDYSRIILLNDLQTYVEKMKKINIFTRMIINRGKTRLQLYNYRTRFFNDNRVNTYRKIRIIWGLLSNIERTQFINDYILDDIE